MVFSDALMELLLQRVPTTNSYAIIPYNQAWWYLRMEILVINVQKDPSRIPDLLSVKSAQEVNTMTEPHVYNVRKEHTEEP